MEVVKPNQGAAPGLLPRSPQLRLLVLIVLALTAAFSTYIAVKRAVSDKTYMNGRSQAGGVDFQWSGAHILALHQDPWKTYIDGDPKDQIILGQQPNYLPEFYLMLGPLGRMPFPEARAWWCFLNLVFLAGNVLVLRAMFHLDRDHTLLLAFLVLSSLPFRVTMANGQHAIFILLMLSITFYATNRWVKGMALGVSFGKYSFSPLMVMVLLVKKRLDVLLISLILPVVGLLIAWHILGGNLKTLAFEPIATSKIAMGPGSGDIMTPLEIFMRNHGVAAGPTYSVPALLGLVAAVGVAFWIGRNRRLDERMQFVVAIVMTLLCFKHVLYDFVVLVAPLAAAMAAPRSRARIIVLVCIFHFWVLSSPINHFYPKRVYALEVMIYSVVLLILGIATSRLFPGPEIEGAAALASPARVTDPVQV
ncbi:MAG TPA: glycosyltransferase family 87 protein [Acidisarcina sp.]